MKNKIKRKNRIFNVIQGGSGVTLSQINESTRVSVKAIQADITELVNEGKVEVQRHTLFTTYRAI